MPFLAARSNTPAQAQAAGAGPYRRALEVGLIRYEVGNRNGRNKDALVTSATAVGTYGRLRCAVLGAGAVSMLCLPTNR